MGKPSPAKGSTQVHAHAPPEVPGSVGGLVIWLEPGLAGWYWAPAYLACSRALLARVLTGRRWQYTIHLAGSTGCDWLAPNADCPARPLAAFGARSPLAAERAVSQIRHLNEVWVIAVIKGRSGKPCPAGDAPAYGRTQTAVPGWNGPLETGQVICRIWPRCRCAELSRHADRRNPAITGPRPVVSRCAR